MTIAGMQKRLSVLEARSATVLRPLTPEEEQAAADRYAASLLEPDEPNPRRDAYFRTSTLHQLAADTEAVLRGAPAP